MAKTDIQIQFSDPNPETSISQSESKYNSNNIELKDLTYFVKYWLPGILKGGEKGE